MTNLGFDDADSSDSAETSHDADIDAGVGSTGLRQTAADEFGGGSDADGGGSHGADIDAGYDDPSDAPQGGSAEGLGR